MCILSLDYVGSGASGILNSVIIQRIVANQCRTVAQWLTSFTSGLK